MHSIIIRFERTARNAVLLVYLSALFIATATYFVGRSLGFGGDLLYYVAIAEACAVEVHSFLSQRMARELHEQLHGPSIFSMPYDLRDALERRYTLHLRITIGLVAFSCFNSIAFWATVMQPQGLGDWLQVFLRGACIPLAFLAAGFLTPLHEDVASSLQDVGNDLTRVMVKHASKQWRTRVRMARKRSANLAEPVAMLLEMQEGGGMPASVMIRTMDAAIRAAEGGRAHMPLPAPITPAGSAPPQPPTGPGTPITEQGVRTPVMSEPIGIDGEPDLYAVPRVRTRRPAATAHSEQEASLRRRRIRLLTAWVREIQAAGGEVVKRDLIRRLRRAEHSRVSESTVSGLVDIVLDRLAREAVRTHDHEEGQLAQ